MRFLTILLIAGIGTGLYFTRDTWYNKLRGIGEQYRTIENSGKLASGNFPIEVSGGADYQFDLTDSKMIVLSDTYTYFYDTEAGCAPKSTFRTRSQSPLCTWVTQWRVPASRSVLRP